GEKGDGFEYIEQEEDEFENLAATGLVYNMANLALSAESISTLNSEDEDDFSSSSQPRDRSTRNSFLSVGSDTDSTGGAHHADNFHHDAAASIFDSLQRDHDTANIQLELTALRMSTDASFHQLRKALAVAFMKRIAQLVEKGSKIKEAVERTVTPHAELLNKAIFDQEEEEKSDQADFLLLVQHDLSHRPDGENVLLVVSFVLNQSGIVEPEGFEQWWEDLRSVESEEMRRVRGKMAQFIETITADDDDEDEDDETSEEDEDED
ncbi:hypothetical protein LTS18_013989, partial [Coniosporium uncinatum]